MEKKKERKNSAATSPTLKFGITFFYVLPILWLFPSYSHFLRLNILCSRIPLRRQFPFLEQLITKNDVALMMLLEMSRFAVGNWECITN